MAARTRKVMHDEFTRQRIKTSQIVNRLEGHVFGKTKMVPSQVTAALGLLKKALPDLQATEHSGPDGGPIQTADVSTPDRARALAAFVAKTRAEPK